MLRQAIVLLLFIPQLIYSQTSDLPFQILVAKEAYIFGRETPALTYVDDVTSIEVKPGGFVALVHQGGTTYEFKEKVFTFYLKPEELKEVDPRPDLMKLYDSTMLTDDSESIAMLYPPFDKNRVLRWWDNTPINIHWHLPNEPVLVYKFTIRDHTGNKIQDYATKKNNFILKPFNFGLDEKEFIIEVTSSLGGDTKRSGEFRIKLEDAKTYPIKASDLVLKANSLELSPVNALEAWKEVLGMENGKFYFELFELFIKRNKAVLEESGADIDQLLTQNK